MAIVGEVRAAAPSYGGGSGRTTLPNPSEPSRVTPVAYSTTPKMPAGPVAGS